MGELSTQGDDKPYFISAKMCKLSQIIASNLGFLFSFSSQLASHVSANCTDFGQYLIFPPIPSAVSSSVEVNQYDSRKPGGSVHGERANFTGLVLGCIDADFCK